MKSVSNVVVHKEDDLYVAECPEYGTASQGESIEEAVMNLHEATGLYLEEFPRSFTKREDTGYVAMQDLKPSLH